MVRPEIVQTMLDMEFGDAVSCLVRVVWAAAAGNLRLASSSSLGSAHSDQQASRFLASRRSRDSSTGSSHRYKPVAKILPKFQRPKPLFRVLHKSGAEF